MIVGLLQDIVRTLISLNVKNGKKDVAIAHKKKKSIRVHF